MSETDHILQGAIDLDSLPMEEIIEKATFSISSIDQLDVNSLSKTLNDYTFAIISGLIQPSAVKEARQKIDAWFDPKRIRPATGEDPSEIMDNFHKFSLGGAEHSGVYRPRCMGTIYNPIWSEDIFGLREAFRTVAQVRNVLYGFDLNYAVDEVENGFWTAARIHHYPAGGGFLVSHLDNIVPVVQEKSGLANEYFQPVLVMSKKGKEEDCDFVTGGGFFQVGSRRYFYEENCELGDIVIYSGRTIHGVADIDLHETMDSHRPAGRFGGFVTLYKHFNKKNEVQDFVEMSDDKIVV